MFPLLSYCCIIITLKQFRLDFHFCLKESFDNEIKQNFSHRFIKHEFCPRQKSDMIYLLTKIKSDL